MGDIFIKLSESRYVTWRQKGNLIELKNFCSTKVLELQALKEKDLYPAEISDLSMDTVSLVVKQWLQFIGMAPLDFYLIFVVIGYSFLAYLLAL